MPRVVSQASRTTAATAPGPTRAIAFGGDYNPEQWPVEVHDEDVRLMRVAGVDLVTLGVFSWAHLQPAADRFEFEWLDEAIERLHAAGIRVDLATATASPPPWLTDNHPEMLPVTAEGTRLWPGARQGFCPSSPRYREHALALCRAMARRYGTHPAVVMWHVSNELGCHNALCYCDVSADAFRRWLRHRYGEIEQLNHAWGTAFWSQRYADFAEILPPRAAPNFPNPTQQLDFHRFSSDELLAHFVAERDILHDLSPGVPVTTNLMVMSHCKNMDYHAWSAEMDIVSNDHYLVAADPEGYRELAFASDLVRGVAGGQPWIQMEQSTSAVNWQPRNVAKQPGELLRNCLQHLARGADGILFFQWRASRAGAEKFHAALVPHAGTDTRVWREVVELSRILDRVDEVAGSTSDNAVALLFDWQAWWACELDSHPSVDVRYLDQAHAWHREFTDRGVGVDVVHPEADLTRYRLILIPTLYAVTDAVAQRVTELVNAGATVLVTYFSGIVDYHDHIRLGGYPGAFRELLGIRVEEFSPLREHQRVQLSTGGSATIWTEDLRLAGAESLIEYVDGPLPGVPALTRRRVGDGSAWYVATRLDQEGVGAVAEQLLAEAGVRWHRATPGLELVRRVAADGQGWLFVINHRAEPVSVACSGRDLVTGHSVANSLTVGAGGVAVVRES
ncbi:MAG: beta-galactosidase [Nocardioides sp.]